MLRGPRFERALIRWFQKNHSRFLLPIALEKINRKKVALMLTGYREYLSVHLNSWNLCVSANWNGICWDFLLELDVSPVATRHGYYCKCCEKPSTIWPSLEALYQDHLFEPLLQWVNEELFNATQLLLYGSPGSSTWAALANAKDNLPEPETLWVACSFEETRDLP